MATHGPVIPIYKALRNVASASTQNRAANALISQVLILLRSIKLSPFADHTTESKRSSSPRTQSVAKLIIVKL